MLLPVGNNDVDGAMEAEGVPVGSILGGKLQNIPGYATKGIGLDFILQYSITTYDPKQIQVNHTSDARKDVH